MKGKMNKQKFRRNLLKQWKIRVKERANQVCEYCGAGPRYLNAHHIISYKTKDSPLKYMVENSIALCPRHHKLGDISAHKNPLIFYHWLEKQHLQRYNWILLHYQDKVDLDSETVLNRLWDRLNYHTGNSVTGI